MIDKLHIKNYKKIKDTEFECKDINVFVGVNNSGKSSVLSAIHFALTLWNRNIISRKKNLVSLLNLMTVL